eukprot:g66683.t1
MTSSQGVKNPFALFNSKASQPIDISSALLDQSNGYTESLGPRSASTVSRTDLYSYGTYQDADDDDVSSTLDLSNSTVKSLPYSASYENTLSSVAKSLPYASYENTLSNFRLPHAASASSNVGLSNYEKEAIWEPTPVVLFSYFMLSNLCDQFKSVMPIASYMLLFQLLIVHHAVEDPLRLAGGIGAAILGITIFIQGLMLGIMPIGQSMGEFLPRKLRMWGILIVTFVLGVACTVAEPAIGALETVGALMGHEKFPYLWALLMLPKYNFLLVMAVGMGVGVASVVGTLKVLYRLSMKVLTLVTLAPCIALTVFMGTVPALESMLGLCWDCGAITTGPVTVPLVLAMGIGVTVAAKEKRRQAKLARKMEQDQDEEEEEQEEEEEDALEGFGIVTLASLFPVVTVQLLCIYVWQDITVEDINRAAQHHQLEEATEGTWFEEFLESSPGHELFLASRAIIPLSLYIIFVTWFLLKKNLPHFSLVDGMVQHGFLVEDMDGTPGLTTAVDDVNSSGFMTPSPAYANTVSPGKAPHGNKTPSSLTKSYSMDSSSMGGIGSKRGSVLGQDGLQRSRSYMTSQLHLARSNSRVDSGLPLSGSAIVFESVVSAQPRKFFKLQNTPILLDSQYDDGPVDPVCNTPGRPGQPSEANHVEEAWETVKTNCFYSTTQVRLPRCLAACFMWSSGGIRGQQNEGGCGECLIGPRARVLVRPENYHNIFRVYEGGCGECLIEGGCGECLIGPRARVLVRPETIMASPLLRSSAIPCALVFLCYCGMIIFNYGLKHGLQALAKETGRALPSTYAEVEGFPHSPEFNSETGIAIVMVFVFMLGMVATMAEPALNVLGVRVEFLTAGRFKARALTASVSLGVGVGLLLGGVKVMYGFRLVPFLLGAYAVTAVLTILSSESYVSIAWDCAGVTTGEITVPLVLAVGVAMGNITGADGFGILALASVCPIATVLTWGIFASCKKGDNKCDTTTLSESNEMVGRILSDDSLPY